MPTTPNPLRRTGISGITPQLFLELSEPEQKELLSKKKDSSMPLWLGQMQVAIRSKIPFSYSFLTPNKPDLEAMDSIYNKFSIL